MNIYQTARKEEQELSSLKNEENNGIDEEDPSSDRGDISVKIMKELYCGDWAGHLASFSCKTGKLVPVPEHLVPESMIEWGAVPEVSSCV